jgi:hypothetical protein
MVTAFDSKSTASAVVGDDDGGKSGTMGLNMNSGPYVLPSSLLAFTVAWVTMP